MKRLLIISAGLLLSAAALSETQVKDELSGLRPDTQGVETNAFWDTRLHGVTTVAVASGVSTNQIATAWRTVDLSGLTDLTTRPAGLTIILR